MPLCCSGFFYIKGQQNLVANFVIAGDYVESVNIYNL
jgi:hypothetical protein